LLLRFVAGRAGSGKSTWVYQAVKQDMAQSSQPVYLLVPEQFTLQTEKELIDSLGIKGFMQARVTSPSRLAEEVFSQVEQNRKTAIGECGLAMALRAAASQIAEDLHAFKTVLGYNGFSSGMVKLISEMKRFDITPEDMIAASTGARGALKAKVQDVAAIYREYNEYLSSRNYTDNDDRFNGFIASIEKAEFLKNCNFYFDGFDYLSPQNCRMIGELLSIAGSVTITQDFDGFEGADADLFKAAQNNITRLSSIAKELGAEIKWVHIRSGNRQSVMPPDIAHLERNLFAWPAVRTPAHGGVVVCRAGDIEEEVKAAAIWIVEKVRQGSLHWREVAVQCGDLESYGPVVGRVFARYAIPAFIDSRKAIVGHPAIRFLLSLVKVIERDYRADDVMRLVKSGYAGITPDAADQLEIYLTAFMPRGTRAWGKDWLKGQDAYDLPELNRCRKTIHSLVQTLIKGAGGKKGSASRWAKAMFDFLSEMKLDEKLDDEAASLRLSGFIEEAAVTERIWNSIIDILDELHEIIGDEVLDAAGFNGILESGFESVEEGIIPTGVDQVQVGSIGRSKYSGLKYMLIIGASDGSLTDSKESGGILTGRDIDALAPLGVEVGRGSTLKASQKRFALYEAITKGSEGLYISWSAGAGGSGESKPDRIVERILELLEMDTDDILDAASMVSQPSTAGGSFSQLPILLRKFAEGTTPDVRQSAMLNWYSSNPAYSNRIHELLDAAAGERPEEYFPAVGTLLGGVTSVSASQLETYGSCPFRHFVEYVLVPAEWREHGVEATDAGKFLHAAMERFSQRLALLKFDVSALSEADIALIMNKESQDLAIEFDYGVLGSSAKLQWTGTNLAKICSAAAVSFSRQLKNGAFVPFGQEIRFGKGSMPAAPILLDDGSFSFMQGRIDRLDVCSMPEEDWLRVIDYKSGKNSIDVYDAINGIDTQTWLYMVALQTLWSKLRQKAARATGAYIFPLINPWVDDGLDEEKKRREELRLKGWCLKEDRVITAMDSVTSGGRSELFNFNASRGSGVYEETVVSAALNIVAANAKKSIGEIKHGHIAALPWRSGKNTACETCTWSALCKVDVHEGRRYRQLLDKDTIDKMLGKTGEVNGDGMDS
jgi:ATP-dependent helicase/nuclease subunit B